MKKLVFIGFGEASYYIAKGLTEEGIDNIAAYDINVNCSYRGKYIRDRAQEIGVKLTDDIQSAYTGGDFIISLTSSTVAYDIAQKIIPNLVGNQIYADMNSTAPQVKEMISKIARKDKVKVCDVAIMGTVPEEGYKVNMLVSGDGSDIFYESFSKYNMNISILDNIAGNASAIKMLRSVVMKGIPQLLFESFEAAEKFGVFDYLLESLNSSLYGKTIDMLAANFISRTLINSKRRAYELKDVIHTLDSIGVDSSMAQATYKKLDYLSSTKLSDHMVKENEVDKDYRQVIKLLIEEKDIE